MERRCLPLVAASALVLVLAGSAADAGPKYTITLESGATYTVEKIDEDSYVVSDGSDQRAGSLEGGGSSRGAGGEFEVFDAEGNLLGTANLINPDALELIDEHLRSGS